MEGKTLVIMPQKTTIKTVVRKKADLSDLAIRQFMYLVPTNGGHTIASYEGKKDGLLYFDVKNEIRFRAFTSLDNIYVL